MILFAGIAIAVISCKKDRKYIALYVQTDGQAFIKVLHVSPNFRVNQSYPDSFNIYVGNNKVNGPLFTYNSAFPTSTINTDTYFGVASGAQTIRFSLQGVSSVDSLTIITLQKTLDAGKFYTLFITDSIRNQQEPTKTWIADNNSIPDTGSYNIRFAHMILNDSAGKKVDVYSYRAGANIFSNISPSTITDYTTLPFTNIPDTISIRRAGTATELASIKNSQVFVKQRLYTILYKGNPGSTAGAKGRSALVYNNR